MRTSTALVLAFLGTCQIVFMMRLWVKNNLSHWETKSIPVEGDAEVSKVSKTPTFSWRDAPSTHELDWKPCYKDRECTRLSVPLDYTEPNGRQASIALVRKKAVLSNTSQYRGPVLINPGGPGGSGVDLVGGPAGDLISTILGPEFDAVGFDPRGIARSTPRASFFRKNVQRALFSEHTTDTSIEDHDEVAQAWSRAKVLGKLAEDTDDGYLQHIHTDHTARDMVSIVEAHGREKLQYWGFSYGSILGATFAAMFPDRVERLVIDGVADAENYYATLWNNNLRDADKALEAFFTGCAEAGPEACPFWAADPADIRQNLTNLYDTLSAHPIPVVEGDTFGVLEDKLLRSAIFVSLLIPYVRFPLLGEYLADPVKHAGKLLQISKPPPFTCACNADSDESAFASVDDGTAAVACNDGATLSGGLKSLHEYFDDISEKSEWGPIWSRTRVRCAGWPKYPKKHFRGPFVANTSHPILLVGTTADPVTPLWAAKKMSKGFANSVVLTQDSPGHCSPTAPSLCTQLYIRDYFLNGKLPPPETVCPVLEQPFPAHGSLDQTKLQHLFVNDEVRRIYQAVKELSRLGVVSMPFMI